jgi:hypothetical protein
VLLSRVSAVLPALSKSSTLTEKEGITATATNNYKFRGILDVFQCFFSDTDGYQSVNKHSKIHTPSYKPLCTTPSHT